MHDDLTPGTERALAAATTWAHRLSAESVAPLHVLLGLLDEPEGAAAALMRRAGLDIDQWRSPYLASPIPMESATRPLSPQVTMALGTARSLARDHAAERAISTELLAIALVQIDAGLVADLTAAGLKSAELLERIAAEPGHFAPDEPLDLSDPVEQADAARILDASANRAREALRVLEDFARFARDDAGIARDVKAMRHELADALEEIPPGLLLASRETQADVGTEIHAERELTRHSLTEVVLANLKRLQESLRSLEEVGKIYGSQLGQRLKRLRYQSYTLERVILLNVGVRERLADARLYLLLSGATCRAALDWTIAEAAAGGAQIIQLREKELDDREWIERARNVRRWTNQARVLFIMNDRPDIARLVGADGVHLGQNDLSIRDARRIFGPRGIIGVSTHDIDQVRQAVLDGADYIGVGPTFPSATKQFDNLAGLAFVRAAMAETSLPAFVLGGVTAENVEQVKAAGGKRVAVSAAIAQADDPRAAAAELRRALEQKKE
jgi:thiamine-phosphate pyrophosphorylase